MTIAGVADTHAVLWYLFRDERLSTAAREFIDQAATVRCKIAVSSITLVELVYLVEEGRIVSTAYEETVLKLKDPMHVFVEAHLSESIVASLRQVRPNYL